MRFSTFILPTLFFGAALAAPASSKVKSKGSNISCVCPLALGNKHLVLFSEENPTVDQAACDYYPASKGKKGSKNTASSEVICQYGFDGLNEGYTCSLNREYRNGKWHNDARNCPRSTRSDKAVKPKQHN